MLFDRSPQEMHHGELSIIETRQKAFRTNNRG